jgi:hypothetical protein
MTPLKLPYGISDFHKIIKTVFLGYFGRILQEKTEMEYRLVENLSFCVREMAYRGKVQPFVDFIGTQCLVQRRSEAI